MTLSGVLLSLGLVAVCEEFPLVATARCELRSVICFWCAKGDTLMEIYRQFMKCMDIKNVQNG